MIAVLIVSDKDEAVTGRHDDGATESGREMPGIEKLEHTLVQFLIDLGIWIGLG